jgi:hypothetical protein
MIPTTLRPGLLYLFVFGPGKGESIVIRVPDDTWIVIDSCRINKGSAAARLLRQFGAQWSCLVLTHRHDDHYRGFLELFELLGSGPLGCADPTVVDWRATAGSGDAEAHRRQGQLEQIITLIHNRWRADPDARWLTYRGTDRRVGRATLYSLHPEEAFAKGYTGANPNELSSAILLEWERVRLLLASDVVNPHWDAITVAFPRVRDHQAMKAPHHGSRGAVHPGYAAGPRERLWIVTPFSPQDLPRFADGDGVYLLLQAVSALHLTGLPVAHSHQAATPCETTRAAYRDGRHPVPLTVGLPGGDRMVLAPSPPGDFPCCVAASFAPDGSRVELEYGPGCVVVTE